MSATGFSSEPNYAVHGIQFRMYGMVVAVGLNTVLSDRYTPGIYYTSRKLSNRGLLYSAGKLSLGNLFPGGR